MEERRKMETLLLLLLLLLLVILTAAMLAMGANRRQQKTGAESSGRWAKDIMRWKLCARNVSGRLVSSRPSLFPFAHAQRKAFFLSHACLISDGLYRSICIRNRRFARRDF
jgi:hypothetical protein